MRVAKLKALDEFAAVDFIPSRIIELGHKLRGRCEGLFVGQGKIALHFITPVEIVGLDLNAEADEIRLLRHEGKKLGVGLGVDVVVRIHRGDQFGSAKIQPRISRGGESSVGLVNDADARVARGVFFEDVGGVIGRAVVDADDFDVAQRLLADAVQAAAQPWLDVVDGDDDAELRGGWS